MAWKENSLPRLSTTLSVIYGKSFLALGTLKYQIIRHFLRSLSWYNKGKLTFTKPSLFLPNSSLLQHSSLTYWATGTWHFLMFNCKCIRSALRRQEATLVNYNCFQKKNYKKKIGKQRSGKENKSKQEKKEGNKLKEKNDWLLLPMSCFVLFVLFLYYTDKKQFY